MRKYDKEFKEAVKLSDEVGVKQAAAQFRITRWRSCVRSGRFTGIMLSWAAVSAVTRHFPKRNGN